MVSGGLHALAVVLLVAAAAKLTRPTRAVEALRQARLPGTPMLVRLLAALELAVAGLVLVVGGPVPALALAALHLGFAAFVIRLRATGGASATCGCFGGADAPAERLHVVVNLVSAGVAAAAAVAGADALASTVGDQPAVGLPYLLLVAVAAQALVLTLTGLPRLMAAGRQLA
jgi:hypothetical protein